MIKGATIGLLVAHKKPMGAIELVGYKNIKPYAWNPECMIEISMGKKWILRSTLCLICSRDQNEGCLIARPL